MKPVNVKDKFGLFTKTWTPHIIAELNGQQVKIARLTGKFVRHTHEDEDELFYLVKGTLFLELDNGISEINEGELIVVPKGTAHLPYTREGEEAWVMLFEPAETKHTGEVITDRTVAQPSRI
jgi:mannose-6-phosphate isomerase-like protein (cupin superfamily)